MVFCGEHSRGCHRCRQKKTRCDAQPAGCSQCVRVNVTCPGYRNQGDLIFRDSTSKVIKKVKAKQARDKSKATSSLKTEVVAPESITSGVNQSKAIVSDSAVTTTLATLHDLPSHEDIILEKAIETAVNDQAPSTMLAVSPWVMTFAPSFDERAVGFFMSNYVIGINGPTRGHFDYFTEMPTACTMDEGLDASIKAVGFAGYSHTAKAPALFRNAQQAYTKALKLTNEALACPIKARQDTTLMSVLILSMFETVTGMNETSLTAWSQHINGAAMLVKLRGREQVHTLIGRRLLCQVNALLILYCLQHEKPMPNHVVEIVQEARNVLLAKEPSWRIHENLVALTTFSGRVKEGFYSDPQYVLDRSMEMDQAFINITEPPPPLWEYEIHHTDTKCEHIFNGTYHVYHDYWMAQVWNTVRCARIIIHNIIREVLLHGFSATPPRFIVPKYTTQFQSSTDSLYTLQADILSTVAQHLGLVSRANPYIKPSASSRLQSMSDFNAADTSTRFSGGYFLVWPLWFMGIMSISTDQVRSFVAQNLGTIKNEMGIQIAGMLAVAVEKKQTIFEPD